MSSRSTAILIGRTHARGPNLIYTRRLYAEGSLIFAAMARTLSQCLPPRESAPSLFHACVPQFPTLSEDRIDVVEDGEAAQAHWRKAMDRNVAIDLDENVSQQ